MNKSKGMKHDIEDRWSTRDECYAELGNAIVLQAVTDWKTGWKKLQKQPKDTQAQHLMIDSEIFFKSDWYKQLCLYPVKDLMNKLPGMAKSELLDETKRKWICAYKRAEEFRARKPTKTNLKNIENSERRMTEAEEDMRSSWFISLYHIEPEQLLQECEMTAEEEMAESEANKRKMKEIRDMARKSSKRKKLNKSERS